MITDKKEFIFNKLLKSNPADRFWVYNNWMFTYPVFLTMSEMGTNQDAFFNNLNKECQEIIDLVMNYNYSEM